MLLLIAATQPLAETDQIRTAPSFDLVQEGFAEALALLEAGYFQMAAAKLQLLFDGSPTPRVRLELARALALSGDARKAKLLFIEAYKADPPTAVKANILLFLSQIDRQLGKVTYGLGAGFYANPLQQPGSYSFNFGGIDLTYEADSSFRDLWGVNFSGGYQKQIRSGLFVSASVAYRELPGTLADRLTLEASASKKIMALPVDLAGGVLRLQQKNQSFTLPYTQVTYTKSLNEKSAFQPSLRLGYYVSDAGRHVSGWQVDASVPFVYAPTVSQYWTIGPSLLRHQVGFAEQSYSSASMRGAASLRSRDINVEAGLQARFTRFDAVDPFWGQRREDKGLNGWINLSSDRLRLGPFLPALGISCERIASTISYYQQRGCDTSFELRKLF